MHSRIFQISTEPIEKEDYIEESTFYDTTFVGEVADYVNENTDRNDDIEWLKCCYENVEGIIIDNGTITITDKKKYFEKKFEKFKEQLNKLETETTLEAFAKADRTYYDFSYTLWELKCAAEGDKFGFYVYDTQDGLYRFDDFVRYYDENVPYYIGATIDYHS